MVPKNWREISQRVKKRSPKQCRERYTQILKPGLNHAPISEEEGAQIVSLRRRLGNQWALIGRMVGNRGDCAVKNWWYSASNRATRAEERARAAAVEEGARAAAAGHGDQPEAAQGIAPDKANEDVAPEQRDDDQIFTPKVS